MATKTKKRKRKLDLAKVTKLSTLLAIGLRDLRKQERGKGNEVTMSLWWCPRGNGERVCHACLAGSVMKYSLGKPAAVAEGGEFTPWDYGREGVSNRLLALNCLREGDVNEAARLMGTPTSVIDREVSPYHHNADRWWTDMATLLADLKAAGE